MSVLEKAAKAAYDAYNERTPIKTAWEDQPEYSKDLARSMARAVLMAVRDMDPATRQRASGIYCTGTTDVFTAMVDAILAEEMT